MGRTNPESEQPKARPLGATYASDIERMLSYCKANGIPIPPQDEPDVRRFSDKAARLEESDVALHGKLSALIRPATPRTLAATAFACQPLQLGSAVLLVIGLSAVALAAVAGYSATLPGATREAGTWIVQLNYLFAAFLGASFNALFLASPYLRDRTFDPRYILVYILRLVLGVIAGLVLANLGDGLFKSEELVAKLGTGMIGLLGGYSAEAVRAILDRLVEVLLAAVKGSDKGGGGADVTADVLDVTETAVSDPNTPEPVRRKLEQLLKKLQKK